VSYELLFYIPIMQRDQIAYWLGYGLADSGFESWQIKDTFFSSTMSRPVKRSSQPPIQRVRGFFLGGKAVGV
jgi:hypothetical protein